MQHVMWYELSWPQKVIGFMWWENLLFLIVYIFFKRKKIFQNFLNKKNKIIVIAQIAITALMVMFNLIQYIFFDYKVGSSLSFDSEYYEVTFLQLILRTIILLIVPLINLFLIIRIKKR